MSNTLILPDVVPAACKASLNKTIPSFDKILSFNARPRFAVNGLSLNGRAIGKLELNSIIMNLQRFGISMLSLTTGS
jgi:hypothetical protein